LGTVKGKIAITSPVHCILWSKTFSKKIKIFSHAGQRSIKNMVKSSISIKGHNSGT
jgi:hypothetical protein